MIMHQIDSSIYYKDGGGLNIGDKRDKIRLAIINMLYLMLNY